MMVPYLRRPIALLSGTLLVLGSVGCAAPANMLNANGCHVLQAMEVDLPPHARIRVPIEEPTVDLSRAEAGPVVGRQFSRGGAEVRLRNALLEALATRQDLLVDVIGWRELQAYRAGVASQRHGRRDGSWEFDTKGFGPDDAPSLKTLITPQDWESAAYVVFGEVGEVQLNEEMASVPGGGSVRYAEQSLTVRVRLFSRADGSCLLDVSIPVRGDDALAEAARRFAAELATQIARAQGTLLPATDL